MSGDYLFVGNVAWLDFVNTEVISSGERVDLIEHYGDLADWLAQAGLVGEADARAAADRWDGTGEGNRALDAARRFRTVLRQTAERLADGRSVQNVAIDAVNSILRRPVHATEVRRAGDRFEHTERWEITEPDDLLAPVAESVRDMLVDGDLALVRKCKNPDCILFFYDTTKNRGRSWCSMSACGNRTKVAAHYRRHREARG